MWGSVPKLNSEPATWATTWSYFSFGPCFSLFDFAPLKCVLAVGRSLGLLHCKNRTSWSNSYYFEFSMTNPWCFPAATSFLWLIWSQTAFPALLIAFSDKWTIVICLQLSNWSTCSSSILKYYVAVQGCYLALMVIFLLPTFFGQHPIDPPILGTAWQLKH